MQRFSILFLVALGCFGGIHSAQAMEFPWAKQVLDFVVPQAEAQASCDSRFISFTLNPDIPVLRSPLALSVSGLFGCDGQDVTFYQDTPFGPQQIASCAVSGAGCTANIVYDATPTGSSCTFNVLFGMQLEGSDTITWVSKFLQRKSQVPIKDTLSFSVGNGGVCELTISHIGKDFSDNDPVSYETLMNAPGVSRTVSMDDNPDSGCESNLEFKNDWFPLGFGEIQMISTQLRKSASHDLGYGYEIQGAGCYLPPGPTGVEFNNCVGLGCFTSSNLGDFSSGRELTRIEENGLRMINTDTISSSKFTLHFVQCLRDNQCSDGQVCGEGNICVPEGTFNKSAIVNLSDLQWIGKGASGAISVQVGDEKGSNDLAECRYSVQSGDRWIVGGATYNEGVPRLCNSTLLLTVGLSGACDRESASSDDYPCTLKVWSKDTAGRISSPLDSVTVNGISGKRGFGSYKVDYTEPLARVTQIARTSPSEVLTSLTQWLRVGTYNATYSITDDASAYNSGLVAGSCEYYITEINGDSVRTVRARTGVLCNSATGVSVNSSGSDYCTVQGSDSCGVCINGVDQAGNSSAICTYFGVDYTAPQVL